MGEDTASENHPICINMQYYATRFKILACTGSFMKPESQHRLSSLLCGSPWFSSNCLDRSLLHTLPFLTLKPPIAAASLLLQVFQKASQHGTGCTELKCSQHYLHSLLPRASNPNWNCMEKLHAQISYQSITGYRLLCSCWSVVSAHSFLVESEKETGIWNCKNLYA